MDNNKLNPDVCDTIFDFNTIPKLGPNLEGLGADLTEYLCNVLKASRRTDLDPVLQGGTPYNNDVWIAALTGMQGVGDPRFSMGDLMTIGLEKYLKPLDIQLKILQEGCRVINGTLCDSEGKEIPSYGKCEEPNLQMFSYENLTSFVKDLWIDSLDNHADSFVTYLKENYVSKKWELKLYALGDDNLEAIRTGSAVPIFYVKLTKGDKKVYYKYYFDRRNYVANGLGEEIIIQDLSDFQKGLTSDADLINTISGPLWPEKRSKDIFLSGTTPLFSPDRMYVNISYWYQGGAETEIYITNDKWNNKLSRSISIDNDIVTIPENIHLKKIKPGKQFINISPKDNGSICIVLYDQSNWTRWGWRSWDRSPRYNLDISYIGTENFYIKRIENLQIAKLERSYNGGSWSVISPVKKGYCKGYHNNDNNVYERVTCCVIKNIWSIFAPR